MKTAVSLGPGKATRGLRRCTVEVGGDTDPLRVELWAIACRIGPRQVIAVIAQTMNAIVIRRGDFINQSPYHFWVWLA